MRAVAIIPARFGSTRFPGKMLHLIAGKPLLQWVYEGVAACQGFASVRIATDDSQILEAAQAFGADAILTNPNHPSGTDRVAEAARDLTADWIVNVQGDEPLIGPEVLQPFLDQIASLPAELGIATMARHLTDPTDMADPNLVKVVTSLSGRALYFSRLPIPCYRDTPTTISHWHHLGIYAYRPATLARLVTLPPSPLELAEKLEQLRALQNDIAIQVVPTTFQSIGVDTPEDALRVAPLLRARAPSPNPS